MKYFCVFILLFTNICFADKQKDPITAKPIGENRDAYVDPNDVGSDVYIDPNDVGNTVDPYDVGKSIDPNDVDGKTIIDPYDLPVDIEKVPDKKPNAIEKLRDDLFAGSSEFFEGTDQVFSDANKSWQKWKHINFQSPKPPLKWSQVGTEIGAGYAGAFGGSVIGIFSGFLIGSAYDALSSCEQCWVSVAANMSTLGATLGASAGVYMFGNNDEQQGSLAATYIGAVLPVLVGTIAYRGSRQLSRSGFYLATMPLTASLGFNLSRHYRQKGEKSLFDDFFADDMWVSKGRGDVLALNMGWKF